jgi:histidinol-phosphatase (PHP family)
MIDYHIHTNLCKHAKGEIFEYVEEAIRKGISEIAFTDHIPLPDNFDLAHRMHLDELDLYQNWVSQMQKRYPEIIIRFGIEADFYEGFEEFLYKILNQYNFDLVIMSVHFVRHWPGDNWVFKYNFPDKTNKDIYKDYLSTLQKGIETGLFDVLGHVDIIKSPGDSLIKIIPEPVDTLIQTVKKNDMSVEINTSGFRKDYAESYPGLDWLDTLKNHNIPITTGSDAHKPEQVGLQFEHIYHYLRTIEVEYLATYDARVRSLKKLKINHKNH